MHPDDAEVETVATAPVDEGRAQEEEDNPGELVSVWHTMKKQYEQTLSALREAAGSLNSIGEELLSKHGIRVPLVEDGRTPNLYAGAVSASLQPHEAEATPADADWSPPSQQPITIEVSQTSAKFVDELRNNATVGDSEKGFADQISKIFSSFSNF